VTEKDWLASDNPVGMLGFLGARVSARKLRLFACSCCRLAWAALTDPRSRAAVEMAEMSADGSIADEELLGAYEAAAAAVAALPWQTKERAAAEAVEALVRQCWRPLIDAMIAVRQVAWVPNTAPRGRSGRSGRAERRQIGTACANLLRDIFGSPFRAAPTLEPTLLTWHGGIIPQLAQAAYEERSLPEGNLDQGRLAVLADALEEAGFSDQEMLTHLRGPGPHVRGCSIVDLLLGKS
jgi:hypothetical protein